MDQVIDDFSQLAKQKLVGVIKADKINEAFGMVVIGILHEYKFLSNPTIPGYIAYLKNIPPTNHIVWANLLVWMRKKGRIPKKITKLDTKENLGLYVDSIVAGQFLTPIAWMMLKQSPADEKIVIDLVHEIEKSDPDVTIPIK
jgi:hypothetical protein